MMAQLGTYYKKRGYDSITLTVYDDCWVSTINQQAPLLQSATYQINLKLYLYIYFPVFYDTATTSFTNHTGLTNYDCGGYTYELVNRNQSSLSGDFPYVFRLNPYFNSTF